MPYSLKLNPQSGNHYDVVSRLSVVNAITSKSQEKAIANRSLAQKITDYFGISDHKGQVKLLFALMDAAGGKIGKARLDDGLESDEDTAANENLAVDVDSADDEKPVVDKNLRFDDGVTVEKKIIALLSLVRSDQRQNFMAELNLKTELLNGKAKIILSFSNGIIGSKKIRANNFAPHPGLWQAIEEHKFTLRDDIFTCVDVWAVFNENVKPKLNTANSVEFEQIILAFVVQINQEQRQIFLQNLKIHLNYHDGYTTVTLKLNDFAFASVHFYEEYIPQIRFFQNSREEPDSYQINAAKLALFESSLNVPRLTVVVTQEVYDCALAQYRLDSPAVELNKIVLVSGPDEDETHSSPDSTVGSEREDDSVSDYADEQVLIEFGKLSQENRLACLLNYLSCTTQLPFPAIAWIHRNDNPGNVRVKYQAIQIEHEFEDQVWFKATAFSLWDANSDNDAGAELEETCFFHCAFTDLSEDGSVIGARCQITLLNSIPCFYDADGNKPTVCENAGRRGIEQFMRWVQLPESRELFVNLVPKDGSIDAIENFFYKLNLVDSDQRQNFIAALRLKFDSFDNGVSMVTLTLTGEVIDSEAMPDSYVPPPQFWLPVAGNEHEFKLRDDIFSIFDLFVAFRVRMQQENGPELGRKIISFVRGVSNQQQKYFIEKLRLETHYVNGGTTLVLNLNGVEIASVDFPGEYVPQVHWFNLESSIGSYKTFAIKPKQVDRVKFIFDKVL